MLSGIHVLEVVSHRLNVGLYPGSLFLLLFHMHRKTLLLILAHARNYHIMPCFTKDVLVSVPISLITAIFYNKIITNGYCFDPHLPQNFAPGFSGFPQLLQDEDVGLVSAGFGLGL